jgi:hypothetical protein
MAASLFTQSQVSRLIAMPKHARFEDWEGKWASRDGAEGNVKILAHPDDGTDGLEFHIERTYRPSREEISVTMGVKITGRDCFPICRYDIQIGKHINVHRWFRPRLIPPLAPHKHVYNARAVKEGTPSDWDKCASLLDIHGGGSQAQKMERLMREFAREVSLSLHDRPAQHQLFFP